MDISAENARRNALLPGAYDPIAGTGSLVPRQSYRFEGRDYLLPLPMLADPRLRVATSHEAFELLRLSHDFEFWAARCARIRHKLSGRIVPFILNAPQRRVAALLEADRCASRPIRLIMLKARQWGGSTLVQLYMAWIQCVHRSNWHSLVCAHVRDTAATIRGMYSRMLAAYPEELWTPSPDSPPPAKGHRPEFRPFERSGNVRLIEGRGCMVSLASSENPEGVRGHDISMAHLSEVAFWKDTPGRSASDFARAILSGIPLAPMTMVVMESTANGVANFFHDEWVRAEKGASDKTPVFVPWHEIEIYRLPVADPGHLWEQMDPYERDLWESHGLTLEQINWYHTKRREMASHQAMMAEYPTTPREAFISTGRAVFDTRLVHRLRQGCSEPLLRGEIAGDAPTGRAAIRNVRFLPDSQGALEIWHDRHPQPRRNRYVAVVDIGGRSLGSDFSVVVVLERRHGLPPRVAAQWRGHIDHDLLGWKAAAIARYFHNALLVVESNTLESEWDGDSTYILEEVNHVYPNLYRRVVRDRARDVVEHRLGFHTNRSTKQLVVTTLIAAVREHDFEERSAAACDELDTYETLPSGAYAARAGYHDDMLMTRAIGLYVISTLPPFTAGEDPSGPLSLW